MPRKPDKSGHDRTTDRRMSTATVLFLVSVGCVFGSFWWAMSSAQGQPSGTAVEGPPAVAVGLSLLFLFAVIGFAFFSAARVTWRHRCPRCGGKTARVPETKAGTRILHRCPKCRTTWDTGWEVGGGD